MPKIQYQQYGLREGSLKMIAAANEIIVDFQGQGFDLTLRQLYYQFVSKALIPNKQSEYDKLGVVINKGRLAGLIDWNAIVDRTRNLVGNTHWSAPQDIMKACINSYARDKWEGQPNRVEVWIEKDALIGVIAGICEELDVDYFSCRGYTSQSEMWRASRRLLRYEREKQHPIILHLGDHDPSGIDMTRDIQERLHMFRSTVEVERIALNMDQIEELEPPPNPAKLTDKRAAAYVEQYGMQSWELDALSPQYITDLIEKHVGMYIDEDIKEEVQQREDEEIEKLKGAMGDL